MQKQAIYTEVAKSMKAIKKDEPYWPKTVVAQAARLNRIPNQILHMADMNKYFSMHNKDEMIKLAIDSIATHIRFIENLRQDEDLNQGTETTEETREDTGLQDQEPEAGDSEPQRREDGIESEQPASGEGVHRIEPADMVQQAGPEHDEGTPVLPESEMGI